jgi:hypothetical protein
MTLWQPVMNNRISPKPNDISPKPNNLPGHDVINKLFWIMNYKAASVRLPRDNMSETIGFDLVQDGMLHWKGD